MIAVPLCIGLFLALLNAFCDLFMPTIMAWIVDEGIVPKDLNKLWFYGGIMLLVSVLAAGIKYAKNVCAITCANGFARALRRSLFAKGLTLSQEDVRSVGAAGLITRNTNDVQQVSQTIDAFVRMMVRIPITCIGGLILAFMQDTRIALLILSVVPIIALLSAFMISRSMPLFQNIQKSLDLFNLRLREQLNGVRVIRAFNRTRDEEERLLEAGESIRTNMTHVERLLGILNPLMTFFVNLTIMAMILYAVLTANHGAIRLGALLACIQYANQILMAIVQTSMLFSRIPRAMVSMKRMNEVLSITPKVRDAENADPEPAFDKTKPLLAFEHVSYRFEGASGDVLSDINFTISRGSVNAIIGATGSGKSTILSLIERFIDCTQGRILLYGVDIKTIPQKTLRSFFGYVPQNPYLFSGTLEENLRMGKKDASTEEMDLALSIAQAEEFVSSWDDDLAHELSAGGTNVSGGQRQRLSIARALNRDCDLYLFDDSFSALDFATDAKLRQAFRKNMGDTALLLVAQRVGTVMDSDQILVLDQGCLCGLGTHEELMQTCSVYQEIVTSQLSQEDLENNSLLASEGKGGVFA